jgi:IPT/TIG domain-containing protein
MGFVYSEPCCWREIASTKAHLIGRRRDTGELCLARTGRIPGCGPARDSRHLSRQGSRGTRVEINGKNLAEVSAVLFGTTQAVFDAASPHKLVAIVPHKVSTSIVTVIAPHGQSSSRLAFVVSNDPRIPDEVSYRAGYVNPAPLRIGPAVGHRDCGCSGAGPRIGAGRSGMDQAVVPGRRQRGCPQ